MLTAAYRCGEGRVTQVPYSETLWSKRILPPSARAHQPSPAGRCVPCAGRPRWLGLTAVAAVAVAPLAEGRAAPRGAAGEAARRCCVPAVCAESSNMEEPLRRGRDGTSPWRILPRG